MRDDPLIDSALEGGVTDQACLGALLDPPQKVILTEEERRVLGRMSERGAILAVGEGMEKAVVVRESDDGFTHRTAVTPVDVAQSMAIKGWIVARQIGRLSKYTLTPTGRSVIAEAQIPQISSSPAKRNYPAETPIMVLARRKDKNGNPYLDKDQVRMAERIREDYEIAAVSAQEIMAWAGIQKLVEHQTDLHPTLVRLVKVFDILGPSMAETVYRCCCQLEGLETYEKRMGWSARSGKIVLRIALETVLRHEEHIYSAESAYIG